MSNSFGDWEREMYSISENMRKRRSKRSVNESWKNTGK